MRADVATLCPGSQKATPTPEPEPEINELCSLTPSPQCPCSGVVRGRPPPLVDHGRPPSSTSYTNRHGADPPEMPQLALTPTDGPKALSGVGAKLPPSPAVSGLRVNGELALSRSSGPLGRVCAPRQAAGRQKLSGSGRELRGIGASLTPTCLSEGNMRRREFMPIETMTFGALLELQAYFGCSGPGGAIASFVLARLADKPTFRQHRCLNASGPECLDDPIHRAATRKHTNLTPGLVVLTCSCTRRSLPTLAPPGLRKARALPRQPL